MQPNVLIVDDSKAMQGVIAATFRELGIDTLTCAGSGEEAFALVEERIDAFQPVIVDLNMPGISKPKPLEEICRWHRNWKKVIG